MIKRIGIVYDSIKKEAKQLAEEVNGWLENEGCQVFIQSADKILEETDFIITFGGDGLVLKWADKVARNTFFKIPFLRVNFGKQGALTNIEPADVFSKLRQVMNENYIITERTRIQAEVVSKRDKSITVSADGLNEIVIERTQVRTISFETIIRNPKGDDQIFKTRGDAIIFATRTGSTAYAESAGGPTLIKENRFILRVVSPTDRESLPYTIRPSDSIFSITKIDGNTRLVVDGSTLEELGKDDLVIIKKAPKSSYFMEIGDVEKNKK